ncbi:hypothetical protein [Bosea sp. (in: a-proteobacteria)]|uniref:hypothetical protein n=1 Tax=Bosea sp. (in: a-proteobacteria) TaxID=1871050 RepID=UPI002DDD38F5|nr:hypothetical protein [Bosea sp. (in: a-proteobacteria)]HEV2509759.1 hypothetical protein [Bosea sp. (in: a-proteobacteria)]
MEATIRHQSFCALVAAALLAATPTAAQQPLPAVDGPSGKLMFIHGGANGDKWTGLEGAVTVPLGHRFGLQLDGAAGGLDGSLGKSAFYGTGAHLFWRDPSTGMVGIEAGFARLDAMGGINTYSLGLEAERYWNSVTLGGLVGLTDASGASHSTALGNFRYDPSTHFVAGTNLTWYPDDNLALTISGALSGSQMAAGIGVEWAPASTSSAQPSIFARAVLHEGGDVSALAGLSVYFGGQPKPLIRRHREDDPAIGNVMSNGTKAGILFALGSICKYRAHRDNPCHRPDR